MTQDEKWELYYNLAVMYYNHYKHLVIPYEFKTKNGYDYDASGYPLGRWLYNQRKAYVAGKLKHERAVLLKKINANLKIDNNSTWPKYVDLIQKHFKKYKKIIFDKDFKTFDGINYNQDGYLLGKWHENYCEKAKYENFPVEKRNFIISLGIKINIVVRKYTWDEVYAMLKNYYLKYKNVRVPRKFKTLDGITENENGILLSDWLYYQIKEYKNDNLKPERKVLLEAIGVDFSKFKTYEEKWMDIYALVKKYYEHYHDLNIPVDFLTKDGITYSGTGTNIYSWKRTQNAAYIKGKLSNERENLLLDIKFDFHDKNQDELWKESYNLLKKFKETYGHLDIERDFRTTNGIDYDKNGKNLKLWVQNQRVLFIEGRLLPDRFVKLTNLGLNWNYRINYENVIDICEGYNINIENNREVLMRMNHYELNAKINYLKLNNLPLESNGKLHEIFSMCSVNMLHKYNIDYENLIVNYFNKEFYLERKAS